MQAYGTALIGISAMVAGSMILVLLLACLDKAVKLFDHTYEKTVTKTPAYIAALFLGAVLGTAIYCVSLLTL